MIRTVVPVEEEGALGALLEELAGDVITKIGLGKRKDGEEFPNEHVIVGAVILSSIMSLGLQEKMGRCSQKSEQPCPGPCNGCKRARERGAAGPTPEPETRPRGGREQRRG